MAHNIAAGSDANEPITERLLTEISYVLNIPREKVTLWDSFLDLGGNIAAALKLEERLKESGIQLSADDVFRCKTIAELQTHARNANAPPQTATQVTPATPKVTNGRSYEESYYGPPPEIKKKAVPAATGGLAVPEDKKIQRPKSGPVSAEDAAKVQVEIDHAKELGDFLKSAARGDYFCLVKAAMGPFKGKLIAFVSNKEQSVAEAKAIFLPTEDDLKTIEDRIKRFHMALREWGSDSPSPDIWIPLHSMIVKKSGSPATRALQWWLRNVDDEAQERILSLQEERSKRLASIPFEPVDYQSQDAPAQPEPEPKPEPKPVQPEPLPQLAPEPVHTTQERRASISQIAGVPAALRVPQPPSEVSFPTQAMPYLPPATPLSKKRQTYAPPPGPPPSHHLPQQSYQPPQPSHQPSQQSLLSPPEETYQAPPSQPQPPVQPQPQPKQTKPPPPDIVVFKPEPIIEEAEPEDIPITLSSTEAKAYPYRQPPQQPARHSIHHSKLMPKARNKKESLIIQNRLSTTRPLKTFSMWIEDESGRLEGHEQMGDTPEDVEFFPLSAMQQLFFRTSMNLNPKPTSITEAGYRFSQSILLRVSPQQKSSSSPETAIAALVERHSMLRSRFRLTVEGWAQVILPESHLNVFRFNDRKVYAEEDLAAVIREAQASINPIQGPVFSVDHVTTSDNKKFLFLAAHHLAVDLASWRTLLHDLDELLREGTLLSHPSIPFSNWIEYQGYESSHRLVQPKLPFEVSPPSLGYWDLDLPDNQYGKTKQFSFSLGPETTRALRNACENIFRTEPADVFLTALLISFCQTFPDREAPTMWTQEHGRDTRNPDFNIDETVGWFTSLCPINLKADTTTDIMELLKLMKDTRKAIPNSGINFFNTEFLTPSQPFTTTPVEIMVNCVDKLNKLHREGGLLEPVAGPDRPAQSVTSDIGPDVGRLALFEISVSIENDGTMIEALYVTPKRQDRIEQWLRTFESSVQDAVRRLNTMGPELTLADAPLLNTTYQGLQTLATTRLNSLGLHNVGEIETVCPVSPAQQEILITQSQDPESFYCHGIYELTTWDKQPVSQTRLCSAWATVVSAHGALRSVFIDSVSEDGLFDQVVLKKASPDMLFLDSEQPVATLAALPAMKFSPGQPRHRLSVCKTSQRTYVRIDASQAICDAISIDNLITTLRQVFAIEEVGDDTFLLQTYLYNAMTMDTSHNLQEWRSILARVRPCAFPSLTRKPETFPHLQSIYLPLAVTRKEIHAFCAHHEIQPAYVLQLAWSLVLRAFVGMDHVSFGYEVTGRDEANLPGMKRAIGSFSSLLPCTIELLPHRTILECLKSFAEIAAVARKSDNPTMTEIQHAARLTSQDLFNTCLSLRDFDNARHYRADLDATSFKANLITSSRGSDCDLSLSTMFVDDKLHLDFTFRNMNVPQAEDVVDKFERAIRLIIDDHTRAVATADLFTERDSSQLLAGEREFQPRGEKAKNTIHQLIYKHAQSRATAQAISAWDGNMTYHQMCYCISTLATYLRNIGVSPGVAVPVVLERSKWAPVIMVAVMKAGGSIVSLDAQDKATVEFTIRQLNPRIVVATDSAWNEIGCNVQNLIIVNERFFSTLPPQVSIPVQEAGPDHGACIIYTPSKSKTTAVRSLFFTHSALASAFSAQGPALRLNKDSRVLQLSAYNLDIALVEILGTLVHGGCVCVPSSKDRANDLGGAMARMNVSWTYMTSTLARRIDPNVLPQLKTVCFRTRRLDEETRTMWGSNRTILLAYGAPDVCPLGISIAEVTDETSSSIIPQPIIGKFWILNPEDSRKLMPLGAAGELAIDCPLLTPQKYVPGQPVVSLNSSFSVEKPTRLRYLKTGHRVRYLDDGSIQFLSTIRDEKSPDGSPLPAAEIEQHLRRCLGGKIDVVVESVTTSDSMHILAAFLEVGNELDNNSADLQKLRTQTRERTQLIRSLNEGPFAGKGSAGTRVITPDHIPSAFIPLKQFPMSTSLKVNRRKLAKKVSGMSYSELMGVSTTSNTQEEEKPLPLTHVEERMRHVWAGVLDIQPSKIKSNDCFIALGGDQFLATKLVVACRKSMLTVSLSDLLSGATLTEVCQAIAASEIALSDRHLSETRSSAVEGFTVPGFDEKFLKDCIAPQMKAHRHDILDVAEASAHQVRGLETRMYSKQGGIKCLVFNFNGPIRAQKLQTACETLTRLHPAFRTAFAIHDRRVYQVLLDSFRPEFQRFPCPAWCLGSVADNVIAEDQDVEFKPEEPVTKFTFLDAGAQSTLIIRLSSSQIDEHAVSMLVQDLASLYEGSGVLSNRPSFFDYMRAAQAINHEASIDFWRSKLEGAKMTHFVSHDKPYPPAADILTVSQTIQVDPVSEFGLNFSTILKAAWAITLAQFAASSDVLFGEVTQGANIPLPDRFDMSSLIAPTTNIIPVRIQFTENQDTPLDFLRPIQEQRVTSRPHEGLGVLELVQRCTDWPYWTRFSTVVHHRPQAPVDGSTTLNMGDTTFTHAIVKPGMQDIPDILVVSTMDGPQTVTLEIKYSESRIPTRLAEDALRVLAFAVDTVTNYDTIEQPMVQSSFELVRSQPKVPLPPSAPAASTKPEKQGTYQSLPHDERQALQSLLYTAWTAVLNPRALGVPDDQLHKANFFDLWGSVLPAQGFADRINAEFMKQPIKGLHKLSITASDVIENPSMSSQYDFIVKRIAEEGIVPGIVRRKGTLNWNHIPAAAQTYNSTPNNPPMSPSYAHQYSGDSQKSLRKTVGNKLRGLQSSEWMRRHKPTKSGQESSSSIKGISIGDPVVTELPPRAAELHSSGRSTPTLNLAPGVIQQSNMPLSPGFAPQELPVSPLSPMPRRRSIDSEGSSEPTSPVSPLGPAWLAA